MDSQSGIVRKLPDFVPVPEYNTFTIFNEIPDTNRAKILIPYRRILQTIVRDYNTSLPIFVENNLSGEVSCMDFGSSFAVSYKECKVIHDKVESMIYNLDVALAKNTELQKLRDDCAKIMSDTDFVMYNGIKYSDPLEDIYVRILIEKTKREDAIKKERESICRTLPQIKPVFKPKVGLLSYSGISIGSLYSLVRNTILHGARHEITEEGLFRSLSIFKETAATAKASKEPYDSFTRVVVGIHDFTNLAALEEVVELLENLIIIRENEKILELYKKVAELTDPLQFVLYNDVKYGKSEEDFAKPDCEHSCVTCAHLSHKLAKLEKEYDNKNKKCIALEKSIEMRGHPYRDGCICEYCEFLRSRYGDWQIDDTKL